jgi:hypothetical protein
MRDGTLGASDDISGGVGPETRRTSAPRQIDDSIASGADKFFGPRVKNTNTYIFNSSSFPKSSRTLELTLGES